MEDTGGKGGPEGQPRILIVDDDPVLIELFEEWLRRDFEQVVTARSAGEALETLGRWPCDILITDLRLDDMDGIELMRRARALYPEIRSLIVTGDVEHGQTAHAVRLGADDMMQKPFSLAELTEAVLQSWSLLCETVAPRVPQRSASGEA